MGDSGFFLTVTLGGFASGGRRNRPNRPERGSLLLAGDGGGAAKEALLVLEILMGGRLGRLALLTDAERDADASGSETLEFGGGPGSEALELAAGNNGARSEF